MKGVVGFDRELAWEAVWKDASVAPKDDWTVPYVITSTSADSRMTFFLTRYFDREEVRIMIDIDTHEVTFFLECRLRSKGWPIISVRHTQKGMGRR